MRQLIAIALCAACGGTRPAPAPMQTEPPAAIATPAAEPAMPPKPVHPWPATRTDDVVETLHDKKVHDPYRWLEDEHAKDVQDWMTAEDDFARGELAKLPERDELAARLKQLLYFDAITAPLHRGSRFFYSRKHADKEKTIVYWKQGEKGAEQVLFDPNAWSSDGSKGLGGWWPSEDGKYVAYAVKEHNSDETVTHVHDVGANKDLPDEIAGTKYSGASWSPDAKGFYYTWVPPVGGAVTVAERPGFAEVRYHPLGSDPAKDPVVHEATHDAKSFISGHVSRDGHWLVATISHGWNSSDVYFRDAHKPAAKWTTLVEGVDAMFSVDIWRDHFYVLTNDGAPNAKVYKVDPKKPERAAWREIVPEGDSPIESSFVLGEKLVLLYLRQATHSVEVRDLEGKPINAIGIPKLGSVNGIAGNPDEDTAYFAYTSFTEPQVIYKTSIKTGKVEEWARVTLPVDTSGFVTEQVMYKSKDGTDVSMFIIHRKDAKRDGKNPTLLNGYGGFNVNMTPGFASSRAVWLEHGGVYAIPNLRGGGEYGEKWHRSGMLLHKQNVFDDFIAAGEYLVANGWTTPAHLAISGGSNGGLLVGAALTQRPDLFGAVVCAVPLLDMLRYHMFGSGKTWVPEYGSAEDEQQFQALYAYSPYRLAIDAGARTYPAVLFDSADHDDRVDPLHARKLAAALQALQTGDAPILLRIERNAGHGGADMVKQQVDRIADQLAFLLHRLRG